MNFTTRAVEISSEISDSFFFFFSLCQRIMMSLVFIGRIIQFADCFLPLLFTCFFASSSASSQIFAMDQGLLNPEGAPAPEETEITPETIESEIENPDQIEIEPSNDFHIELDDEESDATTVCVFC